MWKKLVVALLVSFASAAISAKDLIKISVNDASGEKFALATAIGSTGYFSLEGGDSYAVKPSMDGKNIRVDFFRLSAKGTELAKAREVVPDQEMVRVESGVVRENSQYQLGLHGFRISAEKTTREKLMAFTAQDAKRTKTIAKEFSLPINEETKGKDCPVIATDGSAKGASNTLRAPEACCVSCRPNEWVCADCVVRSCGSCCGG